MDQDFILEPYSKKCTDMTAAIDRILAMLEHLARHPEGLSVGAVAQALDLPASATHRMLNDLVRLGYVRQVRAQGDYALTIRLAAIGLAFLGRTGVADVAQPVLDQLAANSGELVRLSVVDHPHLVWVAVAQGATGGLRYDPGREQGAVVSLACSAGGRAWLSTLPQDEALALVAAQGLAPPGGAAEGVRIGMADLMALLERARAQGWAEAVDSYLAGMAAIAVPVRADGGVIGCLSIAGPAARLTPARRMALLPLLQSAAEEIGAMQAASFFFRRAR
jgi:IclR family transcriptional regulator, acetate operon repressor